MKVIIFTIRLKETAKDSILFFLQWHFQLLHLAGSYNQTNGTPAQYNYMAIEFNENFAIRWASYLQRDSSFFEQFAIDKQRGRLYVTGLTRATDYITANPGGGAYFDGVKNLATPTQYVGAIMDFDIGAPPNVWVSGGGNPEVCFGASIILNASGSGTINWYTLQTGGTYARLRNFIYIN
jgi:hypothetical protein